MDTSSHRISRAPRPAPEVTGTRTLRKKRMAAEVATKVPVTCVHSWPGLLFTFSVIVCTDVTGGLFCTLMPTVMGELSRICLNHPLTLYVAPGHTVIICAIAILLMDTTLLGGRIE